MTTNQQHKQPDTARRLEWTSTALMELEQVVQVLDIVNPHGFTVESIQSLVEAEFYKGLKSFMGTGGWYVTVYETHQPGVWHAKPSLMAFAVMSYLKGAQK